MISNDDKKDVLLQMRVLLLMTSFTTFNPHTCHGGVLNSLVL